MTTPYIIINPEAIRDFFMKRLEMKFDSLKQK